MVQRSDDKGDKRSPGKPSDGEASRDAESNAANALRERIRQAGAAATARASDHAPPTHTNGLLVPNSSAPPSAEHSGVRTRPAEPRATSTAPPLFGPPRLTPGAMAVPWPAAPRRRELQHTRDGLGGPPPSGAPDAQAPAGHGRGEHGRGEHGRGEVDPLMATTPAHTPPTGLGWSAPPQSKEQVSGPPAPLESGPAPRGNQATPRGIAPPPMDTWQLSTARTQPMPRVRTDAFQGPRADELARLEAEERRRAELATTKKTQGLLRAPDSASSSVGRYSVHDVSTEYVDTGRPPEPEESFQSLADQSLADEDRRPSIPEEPITEEVPAIDASAIDAQHAHAGEPESADSRPRRSTPKQRVGHRRSSRPEMGHARERGTKRTDPGIRARTLRGNVSPKPAPPLPAAKTAPLPAANLPFGQPPSAAANPPATGNAIANRTSPLPAARPVSARPPPLPSGSSSIVIDPSLSQPNLPAAPTALTRTTARSGGSGYVPLPRDREAYEAFLRSAAGEHGGAPRSRPSWAQQETQLIPRDALEPPSYDDSGDRSIWPTARTRALVGVVLIALSAGVGWWILEGQTAPPKVAMPLPGSTAHESPAVARPITLIATEPTGAELLLDGAVIGNTPLEVARPSQGESLYLIRLRGFEQQMVRITSATHDAMHITLQSVPEPPPPAAPGKAR
jgi:hypothetical protein